MNIEEFVNFLEEKGFTTDNRRAGFFKNLENAVLEKENARVEYCLDLLDKNNYDYYGRKKYYDLDYFPGTISVYIYSNCKVDIECFSWYPNYLAGEDYELSFIDKDKTLSEAFDIINMRMNTNPVTYELCHEEEDWEDEDDNEDDED